MTKSFPTQSIIYPYGIFVLHASKNLMFYAGTVEYHNLVLIGLSEMEEQGGIHIHWLDEDLFEERNPGNEILLTRSSKLPEHLSVFQDIYHHIPEKDGITIETLLQDIYLFELNKETTDLQQNLINGMKERGMLKPMEKKGLFGKSKKVLTVDDTLWQYEAQKLRTKLDLLKTDQVKSDQAKTNPLAMSSYILADLLCRGNMLADLYGKKDAKSYWKQIIALNDQPFYKESTFSRLLVTFREIEPDLFNLVSLTSSNDY